MADTDQSLYNLRYNQIADRLEGFGGGSPMWTPLSVSGGVSSVNSITGAVGLVAGTNITLTPSGQNITLAASGGGTPGGSDGDIQFNDSGAFGGNGFITTDGSDFSLTDQGSGVFLNLAQDSGAQIAFQNTAHSAQYASLQAQPDGTLLLMVNGGAFTFALTPSGSIQLPDLSTDPVAPAEGEIWYNATSHTWRGFNGTAKGTFTFTAD